MPKWLPLLCGLLLMHEAQAKQIHPTYDPHHPHQKMNAREKVLSQLSATEIPALKKAKPGDRQQILCLALGVYHEARGEQVDGQRAVGHVILNRVKQSGRTICDTVYARGQFAPTLNKTPAEIDAWKAVQQQAVTLRTNPGSDNTNGATMFYNFKQAHPNWATDGVVTAQYGNHLFIRSGHPDIKVISGPVDRHDEDDDVVAGDRVGGQPY